MGTGDRLMGHYGSWTTPTGRTITPPTFTSGTPAKDFVKCDDPECRLNKEWARKCKQYGWSADDYRPHCHPVY